MTYESLSKSEYPSISGSSALALVLAPDLPKLSDHNRSRCYNDEVPERIDSREDTTMIELES